MYFQLKLILLKFTQKIFNFFNFKIFYSKDRSFFKNIIIKDIIDVGVAKGTNFLLERFPNSNYYFVEANRNYYDYIEKNLLSRFKAKLFRTAAGKFEGQKLFYLSGPISSFYKRNKFNFNNSVRVKIKTLDKILVNEKISKKSILKIDCEGGELDVLKGASAILKKVSYVIVEIRLQNINTYNASELVNFLYKNNFYWHEILKIYYAKVGIDFMDVIFKKKNNKIYNL
jgi:FkbM family methyltransferase